MQYETIKTTVFRDQKAERQREGTINHVLNGWMPASPELVARMNHRVSSGEYLSDPAALLEDLKLDLGTFGRIIPRLGPPSNSIHGYVSPIENAVGMPIESLCALLPKNPAAISRHRLEHGTAALRSAIACSVTSSVAAESFAASAAECGVPITAGEAFSASVLRQIGLNLLAWNYPANFIRILRGHPSSTAEQEREFRRVFGHTPLSLAAACAKRWNILPAISESLEPKTVQPAARFLREICELGDSFGRKHHRDLFPAAEKEWNDNCGRLGELIGTDNAAEIAERVEAGLEERLQILFKAEPRRFNQTFARVRPQKRKPVWIQNPFLKRLPDEISAPLVKVHESLESGGGIISALSELAANAIPQSGFVRGLICLQSEQDQELRLAFRIGLEPKDARDARRIRGLAEAAVEAKDSAIPLLKEVRSGVEKVTRISSNFGSRQAGVLVLELSHEAAEDPSRDNIACFQAVRKCLECCIDSEEAVITD